MGEPGNEVGCEPEIERSQLPVILPLAQTGIGESLAVGIDKLVPFQLVVELVLGPREVGLLGGKLAYDDAVPNPQHHQQNAQRKMDPGTRHTLRSPSEIPNKQIPAEPDSPTAPNPAQ